MIALFIFFSFYQRRTDAPWFIHWLLIWVCFLSMYTLFCVFPAKSLLNTIFIFKSFLKQKKKSDSNKIFKTIMSPQNRLQWLNTIHFFHLLFLSQLSFQIYFGYSGDNHVIDQDESSTLPDTYASVTPPESDESWRLPVIISMPLLSIIIITGIAVLGYNCFVQRKRNEISKSKKYCMYSAMLQYAHNERCRWVAQYIKVKIFHVLMTILNDISWSCVILPASQKEEQKI